MAHFGFSLARIGAAVIAALALMPACAMAQTEFPPASGKGRVVVMISGQGGDRHYEELAREVARLGYLTVLLDGNKTQGEAGNGIRAEIVKAQHSEHALPGKVAVIGFSLGGGEALAWPTRWPDLVATIVAWFPATSFVKDPDRFVTIIKVPVLMLAGELDSYKDCCVIGTARAIAVAANKRGAPLELVTYPNAGHDFVVPDNKNYDSHAANDGWQRQAARLKLALGG
jgi:dienelactone hydrolase